jgi:tRNA (guanine-N7-)-methyltransferase
VRTGDIVVDLGSVALPLTSRDLFASPLALEVELGVGRGGFLLQWAASHPDVGLLGVERAHRYLAVTALRATRQGLTNVRLVHTTAEDLLFRCLAPECAAAVHVYFPDPWPKKRHHKRRFFRPENVARLAEILIPGGLLRVKTDHDDYALAIAAVLAAEPRLVPVPTGGAFQGVPATHFEIKYARDARPVHRFACRRA